MDRQKVRMLRTALQAKLNEFADEQGLGISANVVGSASFTANNCRFKVEVAEVGSDGTIHEKPVDDFALYAKCYGLEPSDLGRKFASGDNTFEITGLNTRRPKYPLLGKNVVTGKVFKFPASTVRLGLLPK